MSEQVYLEMNYNTFLKLCDAVEKAAENTEYNHKFI